MKLERELLTRKKKTVTLEQIAGIVGTAEAEKVFSEVSRCVEAGLLSPIGSSRTNGNRVYTLYQKYRVVLPEEDYSAEILEIAKLHPILLDSGILQKKPEDYRKYRGQLLLLNGWLFAHSEPPMAVSRKERSFEVFGEEKQLEDGTFFALLQRLGVTRETLAYYDTPEYCFNDYIPEKKESLRLLICENKDIWFNIRRMMFEKGIFTLWGESFDGVVYGGGNKVAEKEALTAYTVFMGTADVQYLYWGDIDREGLNIFIRLKRANPSLDIRLFAPAYREMLDRADGCRIPDSQDNRERMEDYAEIFACFDAAHAERMQVSIDANKRIPQEIISFAVLNEIMR